jgi:hypothetical protein
MVTAGILAWPAVGFPSHGGSGGDSADFVTGSASNQFLIAIGQAHLSVSAHSDPNGANPSGHIRAKGDPFGIPALVEPFELEGPVTCLRVSGNRAAFKYRFKHATGSAAPFQDGGAQVFIEDNGNQDVDRTTFDPPQPAGIFDQFASQCDDPNTRLTYDGTESGEFVVHDSSP